MFPPMIFKTEEVFMNSFFEEFSRDFREDFYEEFGEYPGGLEGVLPYIMGVYVVILLISLSIGIALYLLRAFGVYKMSKTLSYSRPWLAFIPIANTFALGRLAETKNGSAKPYKYSLILLWLGIGNAIFSLINVGVATATLFAVLENPGLTPTGSEAFYSVVGGAFGSLIVSALSITYMVFYYIALYKVYKLFAPDYSTVLLVVSILFGVAEPIILFCLRNKQPRIAVNEGFYGTGNYYNPYAGYNPYANNDYSQQNGNSYPDNENEKKDDTNN